MNLEREHLLAVLPDVTYVLGRRLRPFCLGHKLLLRRLNSPFVDPSKSILYSDVLEAAHVCSLTYEQGCVWLNNPDSARPLLAWHRRLSWFGWRTVDYAKARSLLALHVARALTLPKITPRAEGDAVCSSPEAAILLSHALSVGLSLNEAFNLPIGLIVWLYVTTGELKGTLCLHDPEELAAYEQQSEAVLKEFERRYKAGEYTP